MSHRYNTRFQVKKAAQANQATEAKKATEANKATPLPAASEITFVVAMLREIDDEELPIKNALSALRMYHFLEYNHNALRECNTFRIIVQHHADDFIECSNKRNHTLYTLSPTSTDYQEKRDLALVNQELAESCQRVQNILKKL
jgi:hypothetical protein